ncbi:MAG: 2,3-bisphosphoglycerate-independent phosphoglycerate mutase, partial [Bacteroidota bacterium]|nr:2,3-bisphosphoglycerate-independent phosphoglycerate mutase [Bacteroidota bacterium]
MNKKVILIILDGWGIATNPEVSAIDKANTPFIDSLYKKYSNSTLEASGLAVGLPVGQMGNSEVGHMNIGAGRIVYQDLVLVNKAIEEKTLDSNPVIKEAFEYALANNKNVHFMGLVSDGGVHSHIEHLKGLCTIALRWGITNLFIHAFTDGRDTDPNGGVNYLNDLQAHLDKTTGKIASVTGRYYAMDRDNRWERIKLAYDAMVHGIGIRTQDVVAEVRRSYENGITDEFIKPIINVDTQGNPIGSFKKDDVVLCFNFRTDRGRQITQVLTQKDRPEFGMHTLDLHYVTLTNYDNTFFRVKPVFEKDNLQNTLGEAISKAEKSQIRIAETEKYPHVTFFFSGGRETIFAGEHRLLCASPK